ncbi:MAG TPA: hypothetical protein EYG80_03405 [Flavobacteriaceae bacterium]|nr:hypothetical protein [Flavobacteriaceae bacterium]
MKLLKHLLLGITLVSILNLMAQTEKVKTTGTKPVDEGIKTIEEEDRIKGSKENNNTFVYKTQSLSKIKKYIYIKRKDISHAPFKCLHVDGKSSKITTLFVEENSLNSINFKVDTSKLKVKDAIVVINHKDSETNPTGKEAIVQIDIVK